MAGSVTTTSLPIDSMRFAAVVASTPVTSLIQYCDRIGVPTGTWMIGSRRPCMTEPAWASISAYVSWSAPPISKTRPSASGTSTTPAR